ncbi:MAG: hypothetical protein JXA42_19030, partial [Anaerolineales bacterium]|nr:hypothetical protein [Anaerolineales bacterium]
DAIEEIDPYSIGRMPFMLDVYRLVGKHTSLPAERWFTAPFSLLCAVQGFERVVRDATHDPDFIHHLLDILRERVLIPWIRTSLQHSLPAWAATGDDPWASFPVITTEMFRKFVLPEVMALQKALQPEGYRIAVMGAWGDSRNENPIELLEERVRLQGALRGLDPDVQRLGPELYAEVARKNNVALGLGIDSRMIHDGPVEAIVCRVRDYIDRAARNGRLTLIINNVPDNTPPQHIHAVVAAVRTFGLYPISERLDQVPFKLPEFEPFEEFARHASNLALGEKWSTSDHE